jgi:hypothetical protein
LDTRAAGQSVQGLRGHTDEGGTMRAVARTLLTVVAVGVLIQSWSRARNAYDKEVSAGARPIEGVGTAVAAFVGLLPGGPINAR